MTHSIKTQGHSEQRTMIKINKKIFGYSTVELLFYISLFAVFSLVIINTMIIMTNAFKETKIYGELLENGTIMERMSREIKQSLDISSISASNLVLNTKDESGADKTVEFLLSGSNIQFLENDVFVANLNSANTTVMSINFTQITTIRGKAVKIFLTIKSNSDSLNRSQSFYDTIVLRGGY